ncbi:hypothetical protein IFM89_016472 [Coptis chinensis]|uniref:GDSL esterase/lipase n=1 Tax=Coptis chinensis TaxID=261450 RepID=A0A835LV88_9MAGN|nr:hypothetical protein IFM89_016472 [Coptis chinensis]
MEEQLEYFKEYKSKIELSIGREKLDDHIEKSIFIINCGANDIFAYFNTNPIRKKEFTIEAYQQFMVQKAVEFLQGLWNLGARRIAVTGTPPVGCLPIVITVHSNHSNLQRGCIERYSVASLGFNMKLQDELKSMQKKFTAYKGQIVYAHIYETLLELIQSPNKFGFKESTIGCCRTGLIEAGPLCTPVTKVCPDVSEYVFWDSVHPTSRAHTTTLFNEIRNVIDVMIKG